MPKKIVLKAFQIAHLIREYTEVLQSHVAKRDPTAAMSHFDTSQQQYQQQQQYQSNGSSGGGVRNKSRPSSMLMHGAPVIQSQAS